MAGFFGFFDYSKPGKGVRKDEPKRSHFTRFFVLTQRKFWKLIQLNFIFILFSVPFVALAYFISAYIQNATGIDQPLIVVLGLPFIVASYTAMTYVLRNYANERPVFLFSDFWDAYKSNLKQSLLFGFLVAALLLILSVSWNFYFANAAGNMWFYVPAGFVLLISLLSIFSFFYVPLMIVTLELPLGAILKNGFILSVLCLKSNFITLLFLAILVFALWLFPVIGAVIYVAIGFSLIGFIISYNSYRGIKKYAIDPYIEANGASMIKKDDGSVFDDETEA